MVSKTFQKAFDIFQKSAVATTPGGDPLPGVSVMDFSGPEQAALLEAKERKHDPAESSIAAGGSGAPGSSSEGGDSVHCVVNKLDLLSLLEASRDESSENNKHTLEKFTEQTKELLSTNADNIDARTKKMGAFGEGVTEQFGKLNHRVDKIENDHAEL